VLQRVVSRWQMEEGHETSYRHETNYGQGPVAHWAKRWRAELALKTCISCAGREEVTDPWTAQVKKQVQALHEQHARGSMIWAYLCPLCLLARMAVGWQSSAAVS